MSIKLEQLENTIGYKFQNLETLRLAMTHSSYANEKRLGKKNCNERIEFLGDAVLEIVSSEYLYKKYPDLLEGELTKRRASMVCEPTLAMCAREFHLPKYLLLGKGEELTGGRNRDSIISDAVEALIGAIYLDGGFANAKEFIMQFVLNDIENKKLFFDSKTILQEIVQDGGQESVVYTLIHEEGPDHNKVFTVAASVGERVLGTGTGHTKKAAEQAAAYEAVKLLNHK